MFVIPAVSVQYATIKTIRQYTILYHIKCK